MQRRPLPPHSDAPPKPQPDDVRVQLLAVGELTLQVLALPSGPIDALAGLTPAEAEIVRRLIRGESRRTIAEARGVSMHTIDTQVRSVLEKLDVDSSSELVALCASGPV